MISRFSSSTLEKGHESPATASSNHLFTQTYFPHLIALQDHPFGYLLLLCLLTPPDPGLPTANPVLRDPEPPGLQVQNTLAATPVRVLPASRGLCHAL